jgi:hypothetical protein
MLNVFVMNARAGALAMLGCAAMFLASSEVLIGCTPVRRTVPASDEAADAGDGDASTSDSASDPTGPNGSGDGAAASNAAASGAGTNGTSSGGPDGVGGAAASGNSGSGAGPNGTSGSGSDASGMSGGGSGASGSAAPNVPPPPSCMPAAEVCDGVDNDCDGQTDEQVKKKCWADLDGDGTAAAMAAVTESCDECGPLQTAKEPVVADATDCDDNDKTKSPGATDICGDDIDNDCDGTPDNKSNNACDGPCTMQLAGKPGESCSNGLKGACARMGMYACVPDHTLKCSAAIVMGTPEKCGDNSDNDCDGAVDNGCVMNECGGWTKLSPDKGDACSMGEGSCMATGSYECDGTDRTVCKVQPKAPNTCGGCTALPNLGDRCTADCSPDGTYVCNGADATKCSVTANPKNKCGGCAALSNYGNKCTADCSPDGTYICNGTEATKCSVTANPKNKCGGCAALSN